MQRNTSRDCPGIAYSEPTPCWFHSWGLDYEGVLRRGNDLQQRSQQILRCRLPSTSTLFEVHNEELKNIPIPNIARVTLDVQDATHHSGVWPTQKESQTIGWFADPLRLPPCCKRTWPKSYSFV
ncbi:uncharacterized protein LOC129922589 [Biomphalaria glabrata]|uniref:Uncharacterized protein LOC129922589 n=1 Tax=Biomphalaria glabrata TaxID=6526 RepID=A0A9W2YRF5_BIOGL|nr:uncharacterized protein LOC129922589 [Biomphalaria glabrata]XP_055865251.1 uncharacterized protein LOC129922589 [Biomphalaria glabrata]